MIKILSQIDESCEGNDCWIHQEYALVEIFNKGFVLSMYKNTIDNKIEIELYTVLNGNVNTDYITIKNAYKKLRLRAKTT